MKPRILAIIPARYASTRFPAKMLATIMGKSVLQCTFEGTKACSLIDQVLVATDDQRIVEHVESFGGTAVLTSVEHQTGTDRMIEVLQKHPEVADAEIIINVQGDEPCIPQCTLTALVNSMIQNPHDVMGTAAVKMTDHAEILNPSVVKCVMDIHGYALYFSRSPIPGVKPKGSFVPTYYKHLGIYAFRRDFLLQYGTLPKTPLGQVEDLEQLKVLEAGYKIKVVYVQKSSPHVDIPEDIEKVKLYLCNQNSSS